MGNLRRTAQWGLVLGVCGLTASAFYAANRVNLGKQSDGSYLVSTGQRVEAGAIRFRGRPADLAVSPVDSALVAVLSKGEVFLIRGAEIVPGSSAKLGASPAFHGLSWTPDGKQLIASTESGYLQRFSCSEDRLTIADQIKLEEKGNPQPGGSCITKDGKTLFVTGASTNSVYEVSLGDAKVRRRLPVENVPYGVKLTEDEKGLVVSNWAGRVPTAAEVKTKDRTANGGGQPVLVDKRGVANSGSVSLVDLASGGTVSLSVGRHPTSILTEGNLAWVANSVGDSISEIDLAAKKVKRTIPIRWNNMRVIGAMPNALAKRGDTLYAANGGDNAICEIDLKRGRVRGFRPVGYFPISLALRGNEAVVLNSKGNGSVANTAYGRVGNAHDFEGTVSLVDLTKDLAAETTKVSENNRWGADKAKPNLAVYNGAIQHVLYIIKENRTYDEVFGDLPQGNGDPKLCSLGEKIAPNHRAIAQQFTLFDNGYVSGTNSADGHQWSTQALANDYLERFYVGYSRSYPDDGDDAMALSAAGGLWDAAVKKGKSVRVYGELCDNELSKFSPRNPKDWFELWEDRKSGRNEFKLTTGTTIAGLRPYINPNVHYWPLIQSDQHRADIFIEEYTKFSKANKVPNLMILSLPCDHGEGMDPVYPTPRAMIADNDLALGRVVEAISRSPQWKNTAIFVIEDDAQSGPDHVDGHRTVFMAISPYNKMGAVDSKVYTTLSMLRSIGLMLGLDPMNRFDALAQPMDGCFTNTPNLATYKTRPNNIPLDEPNPGRKVPIEKLSASDRYWTEKSLSLDWSDVDDADPYWLNRINWYSFHGNSRPYPARPGEKPGVVDED